MKHTKLNKGYLVIDHSAGIGLTEEQNRLAGRPPEAAKGFFEADVITCGHCPLVLILNPMRTRERGWCQHCDRYICDACAVTYGVDKTCRNLNEQLDRMQEQAFLALNIKET